MHTKWVLIILTLLCTCLHEFLCTTKVTTGVTVDSSCLVCVLGTEPGSSARVISSFNHQSLGFMYFCLLRSELRASRMLSMCSTTESNLQPIYISFKTKTKKHQKQYKWETAELACLTVLLFCWRVFRYHFHWHGGCFFEQIALSTEVKELSKYFIICTQMVPSADVHQPPLRMRRLRAWVWEVIRV